MVDVAENELQIKLYLLTNKVGESISCRKVVSCPSKTEHIACVQILQCLWLQDLVDLYHRMISDLRYFFS